jgi:hypothetical protein
MDKLMKFQSDLGGKIYGRARGSIATMKKNGQNQYKALKSIFELCDIMLPINNQKGEST